MCIGWAGTTGGRILSAVWSFAGARRAERFSGMTLRFTTSEGKKMGKTERGAVWLDPKTSPMSFSNTGAMLTTQMLLNA